MEETAKPNWETIVTTKRAERQSRLPLKWLVPENELPSDEITDVTTLCEDKGWLSAKELAITSLDMVALAAAIKGRKYTSVEVVEAFAHRATIAQQLVNALTEINFEEAMAEAVRLDEHLEKTGEVVGPLHGIPMCAKDQFHVKGLDNTMGYCGWAGRIAEKDSVTIAALKQAGAIVLTKTNLAHTLMVGETVNPLWGRTTSPFNRHLCPGASSGGDGALLAMRGAAIRLGADTGGSIRVPAVLNELYSLRPSAGRVSMCGVSDSLVGQDAMRSSGGPLAHSARDIDLFMSAYLAQEPWKIDPEVLRMPWSRKEQVPFCFAIARGDQSQGHAPSPRIEHVVAALRSAGHIVVDWRGPLLHDEIIDIFEAFVTADGGQQIKEQHDLSGEPMYSRISERFKIGSGPLSPLTVAQTWANQERRRQLALRFAQIWQETGSYSGTGMPIDCIISPVLASVSIPHTVGIPDAEPKELYSNNVLEAILDLSCGTFPTGLRQDQAIDLPAENFKPRSELDSKVQARYHTPQEWNNSPIGFQITAQRLEEEKVVSMLMAIEAALAK